MIAHIQGKLVEKTPTEVVIDCNGVGYHINISLHTFSLLPTTDFVKLFTHLQISQHKNIQDFLSSQIQGDLQLFQNHIIG